MKRQHPEDALQAQVADYLDLCGLLWCHPPNGGKRGLIEACRLKRLGVRAGVPDLLIFERWQSTDPETGGEGFGVALELKSPTGRATSEQRAWLDSLQARGWRVGICRTFDEARKLIDETRRQVR